MQKSLGLVLLVTLAGAVVGNVLGQAIPVEVLHQSMDLGRLSLAVATFSFDLTLRLTVAGALGLLIALVLILRR
ncbi:MAG: hypothetical protein DIU70_003885 [Bacillota bacterium]|nr:MAG: hypothetical protein DIU70_02405 [Bacillota bacterium]